MSMAVDELKAKIKELERIIEKALGGEPLAILSELDEARAKIKELERERDGWEDVAASWRKNSEVYRQLYERLQRVVDAARVARDRYWQFEGDDMSVEMSALDQALRDPHSKEQPPFNPESQQCIHEWGTNQRCPVCRDSKMKPQPQPFPPDKPASLTQPLYEELLADRERLEYALQIIQMCWFWWEEISEMEYGAHHPDLKRQWREWCNAGDKIGPVAVEGRSAIDAAREQEDE